MGSLVARMNSTTVMMKRRAAAICSAAATARDEAEASAEVAVDALLGRVPLTLLRLPSLTTTWYAALASALRQ